MWLTTSQLAPCPHVPIHGSRHLLRIQALSLEHSVFNTHSGRQFSYGFPVYSGKHSQFPFPLQTAFGPQGDGLHGSDASGRSVAICTKIKHYIETGVIFTILILTNLNLCTQTEWISSMAIITSTNRNMIEHMAVSVQST